MSNHRVMLTAMGAQSAAGGGVKALTAALAAGRCALAADDEMAQLGFRCTFSGRVPGVAETFEQLPGMTPAEQRYFCRFSQLGLLAAREALLQSRLVDEQLQALTSARTRIFIGSGIGPVGEVAQQIRCTYDRRRPPSPGHAVPRVMPSFLPAFLSHRLGATAGGDMISLACNSGLLALIRAAESIARGETDWCLAGGVEEDHVCTWASFDVMRALPKTREGDDPAAASRPFSSRAFGFIPSGAAAFVVLESEEHARRRGAEPLAEVRGWAHRLGAGDGRITAFDAGAYQYAMTSALRQAQREPKSIAMVAPHAHSSQADTEELLALAGILPLAEGGTYVSAPKARLGHSIGASGVLDIIALVAQLRHKTPYPNAVPDDLDERIAALRLCLQRDAFATESDTRVGLKTGHAFGRSHAAVVVQAQ